MFFVGIMTILFSYNTFACDTKITESDTTSIFIVQITDTQFGFYNNNSTFEKETEQYSEAVNKINSLNPDFVVITGDYVNDPRNNAQISEFKRITNSISKDIPVFLSPGNHDLVDCSEKDFKFYYSNYGIEANRFCFSTKKTTYIGINSVLIKYNIADLEEEQYHWLIDKLENAEKSNEIILFTHYPFFINDFNEEETYSNQSLEMRKKYFNLFQKYGVSAIFSGHLHYNSRAEYNNILMISTTSVGKPLGKDKSGIRIIKQSHGKLTTYTIPIMSSH